MNKMEYRELVDSGAIQGEIRDYLAGGASKTTTVGPPENLHEAVCARARLEGSTSFNQYVRRCLMDDLAKKGR